MVDNPDKPQRTPVFTAVLSFIAVAISLSSAAFQFHLSRDASNRQAIADSYSAWLDVSKMQIDYSDVVHLFALGDSYAATCDLVRRNAASSGLQEAHLLLRERGVALYIFTLFEANLYQWQQAVAASDPRADFYKAVLDYQTGRQLRNPRLLYWWSERGLSQYFEVSTNDYFNEHVLISILEVAGQSDPIGCLPPATITNSDD